MHLVVYDLETENAIPDFSGNDPLIKYCHGWGDYKGMGVSVCSAWSTKDKWLYHFGKDNLTDLQKLIDSADCIAGYNNAKFDNAVLAAQGIKIPGHKVYDLQTELCHAAGYRQGFAKGYKLEALAQVNLGIGKSGDGAFAPIRWQRKEYFGVINYCGVDVRVTRDLLVLLHKQGYLLDPVSPEKKLSIRLTNEVMKDAYNKRGLFDAS